MSLVTSGCRGNVSVDFWSRLLSFLCVVFSSVPVDPCCAKTSTLAKQAKQNEAWRQSKAQQDKERQTNAKQDKMSKAD